MALVSTSIKVDSALKQESQELFESFGLSLSAAVNLFLRQAVREQAIPFRVGQPLYGAETLQVIREARQGINVSKAYDTVEEALEALNAED